jgi:hypothetical protein
VIAIADRFTLNENKSHYIDGATWLDLGQWPVAAVRLHAVRRFMSPLLFACFDSGAI